MAGFCDKAREEAQQKIDDGMLPLIEQAAKIASNMEKKGLDPRKYYDAKNDEVIDMVAFTEDLARKRNEERKAVEDEVTNSCEEKVEYIQRMLDYAIKKYTDGLSDILPKHMKHIDVDEILGGYLLGGNNSVFNQIRDDLFFTRIGIDKNSKLGQALANPLAGSNAKDGINQLLGQWGVPIRL